jgi:hypothetical protein
VVEEPLVERKLESSIGLAKELIRRGSPLLAAYWEFREELGRWKLVLVPKSPQDESRLISEVSSLLLEPTYRGAFSLSGPVVDSRQIERARALGAYIRVEPFIGRRIDTTFTGGHYFESVVPAYLAPHLTTHLVA